MMWWLVPLAWAVDGATLQAVHELEWEREAPITLAARAAGGDTAVRIAAVDALGRLQSEGALSTLLGMRADLEAPVRTAVAEALGRTPGAAAALRSWLAETPRPQGLAGRRAARDGLRVRLTTALGRQGDATDIGLLVNLLDEPWPVGAAAARALARLERREVAGTEAAVPNLLRATLRADPRLFEDVAYALGRIRLEGASDDDVALALRAVDAAPTGPARAWLVRAVWPGLTDAARADLFVRAVTDHNRLVRVAALDSVDGAQIPAVVLAAYLVDADPWLRHAAIGALGRAGDEGRAHLVTFAAQAEDPWEAAAALTAAHHADLERARDPSENVRVRAALLAAETDVDALMAVARTDPAAPVRTAAVAALLELDEVSPAAGLALLDAADAAVREAALEWADKVPDATLVATLLPALRDETQAEVLALGLTALTQVAGRSPTALDPRDPDLERALLHAAGSSIARVRLAARELAAALDRELPTAVRMAQQGVTLPDGSVAAVSPKPPLMAETLRIRGARVETDRGGFALSLDPDTAPLAVANFAALAEAGFYDGVVFHRVVPGFVVQSGCPRGDGWGGPGWTIPDEVSEVPYAEGSLGMARAGPDTGGSQWFVTTGPTPHLVGDYTRFGEVVQGLEVVRRLQRGDQVRAIQIERVPAAPRP